MARGFEDLEVYRLSEELTDRIWEYSRDWDAFDKTTTGGQLIRAADSVGANIAEGSGRGTYRDNRHFARIARGSFYETRHFLRRAFRRRLLSAEQIEQLQPIVGALGPKLNAYIKAIGTIQKRRDGDKVRVTQEPSSDK